MSALKSVSIRSGFVDFDVARSVTREEYEKTSSRSGVKRNDVLINSTVDTITTRDGDAKEFESNLKARYDAPFSVVLNGKSKTVYGDD